jgi:inner membrane protein
VSLFLVELIKKQNIHLFNYALIGAAMVVYYTLLLSLTEQIGYSYAYLVSSVATILLIAIFTASLLSNKNVAMLFTFILSIFYGFIFIIIQLENLSLLFGSVALFLIIAALMYFSRKINWDRR